jgi:hypothetical protein
VVAAEEPPGRFTLLNFRRPNHATVIAYLALFVALGTGGAYAANTIGGGDVIDESLTGADIRGTNGTTTTKGTNGSIRSEDVGGQRAIASSGQPYVNGALTGWDVADHSLGATELAPAEAWHDVQAGEFGGPCRETWTNATVAGYNPVGYYRDPYGVVHLRGFAERTSAPLCGGSTAAIFDLPPGYRPPNAEIQTGIANSAPILVEILPVSENIGDGGIFTITDQPGDRVSIDGITFRCGPSGQDGCP